MEPQPKDDPTITMEQETAYIELGEMAVGTIEAGPDQQERLEECIERIARGEFHKGITSGVILPARCVDGRSPAVGAAPLAPNAAGGTESLFVADDLTTKRFASQDGSTASGYANTLEVLRSEGYEVGGHTDSHARGDASGCGANDKLPRIYQYITERGDTLQAMAAQLGVIVPADIHELITSSARARTIFSSGAELLTLLKENAKEVYVDSLEGEHNEVVAVINKRPGTTLDRDALQAVFGPDYQAFNVDAWSFNEAARATSLTPEEAQQKAIAMVYYNLATTLVLAGSKMRIVTME